MRILSLTAASVVAVVAAGAVQAGGYTAPAIEIEPVAPIVVEAAVGDWQGAYVGGTLGYSFSGEDAIGQNAGEFPDLGVADVSGATVGLRAGYRWQRNRFVFGPELSIEGGNVKDSFDLDAGGTFESKVKNVAALTFKTGYEVTPGTLVFGVAGVTRGAFSYDIAGDKINYDASGYVVGFGAERMINDRVSVTGEYEYSDFGTTHLDLAPGVVTAASPAFHNVKLGVNFKF